MKSVQLGLFLCLQGHSGCFLPGLLCSCLLPLIYTLAFFRSFKGQGTFLPQGLCTAVSSAARQLTNSSSSLRHQHKCLFWRELFPHSANEVRFFTKNTFYSWFSDNESACQCRRHGFDPWSGKISHASEQLSPHSQLLSLCSRDQELQLLKVMCPEPVLGNKTSHHNEKFVCCNEEWIPLSTNTEKPVCSNENPEQPKKKPTKNQQTHIHSQDLGHLGNHRKVPQS